MGIDFVLNHNCPVKEALGVGGMIARIKGRNQAQAILKMAKESGEERDPLQIKFTSRVTTPEGQFEKERSVGQLLEEVAVLDQLAPHCKGCAANCEQQPFGCYGYVRYPIRLASEKWLLSLLPADLKSTAGQFLTKAIADFGYDGAPVNAIRRHGKKFLESARPSKRRWGSFFKRSTIDSSQLLHAMFFVGPVEPTHAMMLCLFLGVMSHDLPPEEFVTLIRNPVRLLELLQPPAIEAVQLDVSGFQHFLRALAFAGMLGIEIEIDA